MFEDIIEIMTYALEQTEDGKVRKGNCRSIYDMYRELNNLHSKAQLVISFLSREIYVVEDSSEESGTEKWAWWVNKQIKEYENVKYKLFYKVTSISGYAKQKVLDSNFLSKSLNGEIDEYTTITYIDNKQRLHIYKFNLVKENCREFRHFDELFTKSTVDLSEPKNKELIINMAKEHKEIMKKMLLQLETFMKSECEITNLFCIPELEYTYR
jgi:hypothetical protein